MVARVLTMGALVLAAGILILYLRYRMDPDYQLSGFNVFTARHVAAITPTIARVGQGTLLVTVLFFCARIVVVLRRPGRGDGGRQDGTEPTSSAGG
jgi:hypothetical protein